MQSSPRTLILLAKKRNANLTSRISMGAEPRVEYLELAHRLGAELLDFDAVEASTSPPVRVSRRWMGLKWGLAWMGFLRRNDFDFVYATGEDVGIPLTILLRTARCYGKLVMVVHHAGTPKRRRILRMLGSRPYHSLVCLNTVQERILTGDIGLPRARVIRLHNWIDHHFFQPGAEETKLGGYMLSVGMEDRDYDTLRAAARHFDHPVRIVASGWSPGAGFTPIEAGSAEDNIEVVRGLSFAELRDLYAGARFVVVPLKSSEKAAGVTTILEAMAMGKAVVVSASPGIMDYVEDGVTGRVIPLGDPHALCNAIVEMWRNPEALALMGKRNRAWIEESVNTDRYVSAVAERLSRGNGESHERIFISQ
ncbi:MAG: glycosyltransferase family 4 protein [Gemmatimonadetes bacterium]|nr:glycosyltransferase family 4 protein [Gemmatimonadota bacterium]